MKIKKVDDKPMVIHTKQKAEIHTHEPKQASIKGNNIYMVERGTKTKSTIHQSESKNKGLSRFKRNYRESNTSIKTKNTNLHIAGRTGALAAGAVTEQGKERIFVSMPSYKTKQVDEQGKPIYQDVCYPVTKDFRERLYNEIISEYEKAKDKSNEKARESAEKHHGNPDKEKDKEATPFR